MPAKKPAPKPGKGRKAASRPARKTVARKPQERAKIVTHSRSKTATRKPAAKARADGDAQNVAPAAATELRSAAERPTVEMDSSEQLMPPRDLSLIHI